MIGLLPRIGLAIGLGLLPASLLPLFGRSIRRTPLAVWGMAIAHLGVAVAIIGMASDSAFTRERLAAARPGETVEIGPWLVEFRQVMPVAGPNWTAIEGELRASKGAGVVVLKPQSRFFASPPTTTNEAAIDTSWNGQLYAVLGERDEQGRWQLRLWWKPFVTLIWLGGALIALGGAVALLGRLVRERRQRIRGEEAFE
jgi:cytochrome c-type biogenesis protein CcmF